ncbi:MAG: tripartite tricarboxylate transporter substrate-binding protein [Metallosphaera sp.]
MSRVDRRTSLKIIGGVAAGLVVGGFLGYLVKPAEVVEKVVGTETVTKTVRETVTSFVTTTIAPPKVSPLKGKTITLVVPYAAGGGYDLATRALAEFLPKYIEGVIPIVLNKPGAGALLGPLEVWNAPPNGLTVCLANAYGNAYASLTKEYNMPFTIFDFTPLGRITWGAEVVVTGKDSPLKTWEDFKKLGREIKIGATGIGCESGIPAIMTFALLGVPFKMILGYAGSGEVMAAIIRGEADVYTVDEDTALKYVKGGEVRPLLTVYSKRIETFPDVPALGEIVSKEQLRIIEVHDAIDELGRLLIIHPRTPKEVYDAWQEVLRDLFKDPEFIKRQEEIRSFKPALGDETKSLMEKIKKLLPEFKELLLKVYPEL